MTTRNAITAGLIWGSLWRASLYGVLLGAAFGGLYGAAGGTLTFPLIGTVVGLFFGALSGAVVGLPLGVLDGVLLSWLAVRYSCHERPNARRYRAGWNRVRGRKPPGTGGGLGVARPTRPQRFRYRSCEPSGPRPVLAPDRAGLALRDR